MNWDEYRAQVDALTFSEDFQTRTLQVLEAARQSGKEVPMKAKRLTKAGLIAAVVVLAVAATAIAATLSLRDAARADMGIRQQIPEYTEYAGEESVPITDETGHVELVSTLCSGTQLNAYFRVAPVDAQTAAAVEAEDQGLMWDISEIDTRQHNVGLNIWQVAYDAGTESALLRLQADSDYFLAAEKLDVSFCLRNGTEPEVIYGPIEIPVTQSHALVSQIGLPVREAPENARGTLEQVKVYAGYLQVELEITPLAELPAQPGKEDIAVTDEYFKAWVDSVEALMADATLHYTDGTAVQISQMESPYAGAWILSYGSINEVMAGDLALQHVLSQAIDLTQVDAVTIGGVTYPLAAE